MKNNSALERLYNGIIKENPTLVLILGMCPTLAVTTSAINGASSQEMREEGRFMKRFLNYLRTALFLSP